MILRAIVAAIVYSTASAAEEPLQSCTGVRMTISPLLTWEIPRECFPDTFEMSAKALIAFKGNGSIASVEIVEIEGLSPRIQRCAQSQLKSVWREAKFEGPHQSCGIYVPFKMSRRS